MTKAYHQVNVLEIRDSIKNGERLPIDSKISQALKNLITSTWEQNPRARPSFPGILKYLQAYISPEGDCKALPDTILMNTIALPRIAQLESSLELSSHLAVIKKAGGTPNVKGSTLQRGSKFSHRKKLIILAFILIILASGGVGVYFYTTSNKAGSESQSSSPGSTIPTSTPTSGAPITLPFPAVCAKDVKPTSLPTNCAIQNPVVSDYAGTGYAGGQDGSRLTAATFNYPTGIAFHPDGSLIIGQIGGFRNISGNSVRTISLFTNVTIDGIQQFAIDNTGIMFAPVGASERGSTTYTGYFIITVDTNRNVTLLAGIPSIGGSINSDDLTQSTFFRARQTLIHNGEIYVVSDGKQGGVRFPTTGSIRVINTCVGDPNYGVRTMYDFPNDPTVNPLSIAFDSNGDGCNVTLTIDVSTSAQCIAKFSNGIVNHCFAGTKNVAGTNDGPPNLGKFNFPGGLAFDKCGNLFVADRGNKYTVL